MFDRLKILTKEDRKELAIFYAKMIALFIIFGSCVKLIAHAVATNNVGIAELAIIVVYFVGFYHRGMR